MKVKVITKVIGDRVSVLSLAHDGRPLDKVFIGTWSAALTERNKRLEAWTRVAEDVTADPMPVINLDVSRRPAFRMRQAPKGERHETRH